MVNTSPFFSIRTCASIIILLSVTITEEISAQEFGRFFTTPAQRQYLEEMKRQEPEAAIEIREEDLFMDQPEEEIEVVRDSVKLKGLVYRESGKPVAWINDSNTYEGDTATGYIEVPEQEIAPSGVTVKIPGQKKEIGLKVGQQYEPVVDSVKDIVNTPAEGFSSEGKD